MAHYVVNVVGIYINVKGEYTQAAAGSQSACVRKVGKTHPSKRETGREGRRGPQLWGYLLLIHVRVSVPENHCVLCRVEEKFVSPFAAGKLKLTWYQR